MKNPLYALNELLSFIKSFLFLSGLVFSQCWKKPFYYQLIIKNMYDFGYRSLFIIFSYGISIGSVLSLNYGLSLKKYGAILYVPKFVILSLLTEIGTVTTVFLLAGKIGAGITSEIASMKVSEQLDALKALGVSPVKRVVIPKVLACLIIIPVLCLILSFISFLTSAYVSQTNLHLDFINFLVSGLRTPPLSMFFFGVFKTAVFAFFIAITSCHYGLSVTKSSYDIGRATMKSIVVSFILIIFANWILTKIYYSFLWPGRFIVN